MSKLTFTNDDVYSMESKYHGNFTINVPEYKYKITFVDGVELNISKDPPNWFHRKIMSLLLGWKFEILD